MELLEGLQTRRSIRTYTDQPVTREQLREIIRLGTMAPSGQNNQPWRFVTIVAPCGQPQGSFDPQGNATCSNRSLTPQQAAGNELAPGFKTTLQKLAQLTKYSHIIGKAAACIAVFIDKTAMYHEVKDHQSMGACIQNLLLASHGMGLGAVWLGEILKSAKEVRELCGLSNDMELMAVVSLGHPAGKGGTASRKSVEEVLLKEL
jgi:nitroreductase